MRYTVYALLTALYGVAGPLFLLDGRDTAGAGCLLAASGFAIADTIQRKRL